MSLRKKFKKIVREKRKVLTKRLQTGIRFNSLLLHMAGERVRKKLRASGTPPGDVPRMITRISEGDRMYKKKAAEHYFDAGYDALRCIRSALQEVQKKEVHSILDLPCGHGRVLRVLRAAFPNAEIAACDLETDGVDFCAKTFGAVPIYSTEDPDDLEVKRQFDLIWVGSLLTHVDASRWPKFLRFFSRALATGGVLIFTTHGDLALKRMRTRQFLFGLQPADLEDLLADYDRSGFGYRDYRADCNYGTSLSAQDWVKNQIAQTAGLRFVRFLPDGWAGAQDAVLCVKGD